MKSFKRLSILLVVVLIASMMVVGGCSKAGTTKKKAIVIGKIPITLNSAVHQSDGKWEEQYLKQKYNASFIQIDGKADASVYNTAMEDMISKHVSGIIINPPVPASVNETVKQAKAAGIPVITYYLTPTTEQVPFVRVNEATTSKVMGEEAAKEWMTLYPNKPIKVGIIEFLTSPQIMAMRSIPWMAGVKEVDPSATIVSELDGNGDTQKSLAAAQDMLQSHPEVNLIYATSSNSSIPTLSAFQAAGRGKAVDGKPLTEIICGTDATEAELLQLINPTSALKFTQGMTPHENAIVEDDTIMNVINGKLDDNKQTIIDVHDKGFDYYTDSTKTIQDWLNGEYFMNVDLQAELNKALGK